jgi:hypothetical protein
VSRFFSIPGMSHRQNDDRDLVPSVSDLLRARHPEYYESKGKGDPVTGFQPGEEIDMRGTPARVIGEEFDQHRGTITQWVQESSQCDSGTKKVEWSKTADNKMEISRIQKVTE